MVWVHWFFSITFNKVNCFLNVNDPHVKYRVHTQDSIFNVSIVSIFCCLGILWWICIQRNPRLCKDQTARVEELLMSSLWCKKKISIIATNNIHFNYIIMSIWRINLFDLYISSGVARIFVFCREDFSKGGHSPQIKAKVDFTVSIIFNLLTIYLWQKVITVKPT